MGAEIDNHRVLAGEGALSIAHEFVPEVVGERLLDEMHPGPFDARLGRLGNAAQPRAGLDRALRQGSTIEPRAEALRLGFNRVLLEGLQAERAVPKAVEQGTLRGCVSLTDPPGKLQELVTGQLDNRLAGRGHSESRHISLPDDVALNHDGAAFGLEDAGTGVAAVARRSHPSTSLH